MANKTQAQKAHGLVTYFINKYAEHSGGVKPAINRNVGRYFFEALLMDMPDNEAYGLLDFYFEHYNPDFEWFRWNYEKVVVAKEERVKEDALRDYYRQQTAERLEKWKQRKQQWKKS